MTRVKGGPASINRHRKVLDLAKGYWMSRSSQFKSAQQAVLHAGQYAFAGRKLRKRDFRRLWITRISAALADHQIKYSSFIHTLKEKKVAVDRKILSQLALDFPQVFDRVVEEVKK